MRELEFKNIIQYTKSISQKNKSLEDVIKTVSSINKVVSFTFLWSNNIEYKVVITDNTKDRAGDGWYSCKYLTKTNNSNYDSNFSWTKGTLYKSLVAYMKSVGFKERKGITAHLSSLFWTQVEFEEDKGIFD